MSAFTFHLTNTDNPENPRAIEQGARYSGLTFLYAGDLRTWSVRGQIRNTYRENSESIVKANLNFSPLEYKEYEVSGVKGMYTAIVPTLTTAQTTAFDWLASGMRLRSSTSEQAVPSINVWVYDIELIDPGGEIEKFSRGWVEVILETTEI